MSQEHDRGANILAQVRHIVGTALQLGDRALSLRESTPLVGNLPELDSMAVISVINALQENFNFVVEDDDDMSHAFDTLGSLTEYVNEKIQAHYC